MTRILTAFALAALIAACSGGEEQPAPAPESSATPVPAAAARDSSSGEDGARAWRYTSVAGCQMVRKEDEELPYVETRCDGPAGYALRISDSDARNELAVIDPDGGETPLGLTRIGGGGFSALGETAEWRGPAGETFRPDALIVRYIVAEQPYPQPGTSYLLAIRLGTDPCVVSKIAPGPAQNAIARRRADDPGVCLTD